MQGYRSAASRLARTFRASRDAWKARAEQKQKKLRALEIKVRDLQASRAQWKQRAQAAEAALHGAPPPSPRSPTRAGDGGEEEWEGEVKEGELLPRGESPVMLQAPPRGHVYPVFIIQLAVQSVVLALSSLRGCQRNLDLMAEFCHWPVPSYSSVRLWLFRLGLYLLQRPLPSRTDGLWIVDMTVELGPSKCLVVIGIPEAEWFGAEALDPTTGAARESYALHHQEVEVLGLEVMAHPTGEAIAQSLKALTERIGEPRQVVADHGSDLKKGIEFYQQAHPETIYTYDVTHQLALLLKHTLAEDEDYQQLLKHCASTAQQVQQTPLAFLKPPAQRSKARDLNVAPTIRWAEQVLAYQAQGDFTAIDSRFVLDARTVVDLLEQVDNTTLDQLRQLPWETVYPNQASFNQFLRDYLGEAAFTRYGALIGHAASVGRRLFQAKLGWLAAYQPEVRRYAQLVDLVELAETQLKHQGLSPTSHVPFEASTRDRMGSPQAQHLRDQIVQYLRTEGAKVPTGQTLLATSDVLESLFGKYKLFWVRLF